MVRLVELEEEEEEVERNGKEERDLLRQSGSEIAEEKKQIRPLTAFSSTGYIGFE